VIGRSLHGRLTLLHAAALGLSMALFAASAMWVTGRVLLADETRELEETAERIGIDVERDTAEGQALLEAVRDAVEEGTPTEIHVEVYGSGGALLGMNGPGRIDPGAAADSTATRAAGSPARPRHHERYVSARGFTVDASVSVEGRRRSMAALGRALAWTGIPLFLIVLLAERFITTGGLRPLEDLTRKAGSASVERGIRSLGDSVNIDEVDRLTSAFNRLLTRLDDARSLERRFAADASHELRTPLTVLLGELELAGSTVPPGTPAAESLASAGAQARRMSDLVDALLLLRRLNEQGSMPSGEFETVNLADVARDACRAQVAARPARAGDVHLTAPDEVLVVGHADLLASAMTNLIDNALKFTAAGTDVDVLLQSLDGEIQAKVTDRGPGVLPADVDRLFDPFFRGSEARAKTQGFGLGLPLLRQVARAHGGDVTYQPAPGGGACFILRLPRWSSRSPLSPPPGRS
jgi:two-component system OmpR family sensor kinase